MLDITLRQRPHGVSIIHSDIFCNPALANQQVVIDDEAGILNGLDHLERRLLAEASQEDNPGLISWAHRSCSQQAQGMTPQHVMLLASNARPGTNEQIYLHR